MATPRKHWFRVADSILRETWSDAELATLIRLMAALNTRWARDGLDAKEACCITLGFHELHQITRLSRIERSLERLADLSERVSLEIEADGFVPCVYAIEAGDRIKIGHSMSLGRRLAQIQREVGRAELYAFKETLTASREERALHQLLHAERLEGEWFRRSPLTMRHVNDTLTTPGRHGDIPLTQHRRQAVIIRWPKWSQFQGLADRSIPESSPRVAPSAYAPADASLQATPRGVTHRGRRPSKRRRSAPPTDHASWEQWDQFRTWAHEKHPWANGELETIVDACFRHFGAKGEIRLSWYMTAQNWLDKESRFRHQGRASDGPSAREILTHKYRSS